MSQLTVRLAVFASIIVLSGPAHAERETERSAAEALFAEGRACSDSDANSYCSKAGFCSHKGVELEDDAKSKAKTSTLFVGAGAAALVGAGVLWFTAPAWPSSAKPKKTGSLHVQPHSIAWGVEVGTIW